MKKGLMLILAILITYFGGLVYAHAEVISLDDVIAKFNSYEVVSSCEIPLVAQKVEDEGGIGVNIMCGDEAIDGDFRYESEKLAIDGVFITIPENDPIPSIDLDFNVIDAMWDAIFSVAGHENISITPCDETSSVEKVDYYKILLYYEDLNETTEYNPLTQLREGRVFPKKMEITSAHLTLNKEKLDDIAQRLGDPYIRKIITNKPMVEVKTIKDNSVVIHPTVKDTPSDSSYKAACDIFLVENDGSLRYEKTYDNCLTGSALTIDHLEPSKEYTYKLKIASSGILSDPITFKTSEKTSEVTPDPGKKPGDKENPNTGASISVTIIASLGLLSIVMINFTNNKNRFKKI